MPQRRPFHRFVATNIVVWVVMTIILVVLPDWIEPWVPLAFGRAIGWAVAGGVWVVVIEREWQERMGAVSRFFLQVVLWGSSALLAIWISDQFRV
jgi:hypothetical protein